MPNRVRVLMVPDADRVKLERRARLKGVPARFVCGKRQSVNATVVGEYTGV
jgi:hypothetical protein